MVNSSTRFYPSGVANKENIQTLGLETDHAICITLVLPSIPEVCSNHHQDSSHKQAGIEGLPPEKKPSLSRFPNLHTEEDHLHHGPHLHQLQAAEGVSEEFQHQLDIDRTHHHQLQDVHGSGDLVPVRLLPSHLTESIQLGDEAHLSQMEGLFGQSHAGIYPLHVTSTYLHHHATMEVFKGKHLLINHGLLLVPCLHLPDQPPRRGHQHAEAGVLTTLQSIDQQQHHSSQVVRQLLHRPARAPEPPHCQVVHQGQQAATRTGQWAALLSIPWASGSASSRTAPTVPGQSLKIVKVIRIKVSSVSAEIFSEGRFSRSSPKHTLMEKPGRASKLLPTPSSSVVQTCARSLGVSAAGSLQQLHIHRPHSPGTLVTGAVQTQSANQSRVATAVATQYAEDRADHQNEQQQGLPCHQKDEVHAYAVPHAQSDMTQYPPHNLRGCWVVNSLTRFYPSGPKTPVASDRLLTGRGS